MNGMKEITFEMQTEAAKKIIERLGMPDETTFADYIAAIPFICALIYGDNPTEHVNYLMDSLKDETLIIHTKMRKDARMREVEKI